MKILKTILAVASAVCYLNSAVLPQNDWSKRELKGEVKSMTGLRSTNTLRTAPGR